MKIEVNSKTKDDKRPARIVFIAETDNDFETLQSILEMMEHAKEQSKTNANL